MTAKELNLFLENLCSGAEAENIANHLRTCKECFAMYRDSARYRSLWEADPGIFKSSPDLVALGEGLATGKTPRRRARRKPWLDVFRRRVILWPAALASVFLAAGAVWFGQESFQNEFRLDPEVTAPVQAAIETMSARGPIVLPGGEGALDKVLQVYRAGSDAEDDALKRSIDDLFRVYQEGETGRDVSYWLVSGWLVSGQVDAARDHIRLALPAYREDNAIVTLAALVWYRSNDLARCEQLLRDVITRSPDDAVARLNLGVVLMVDDEKDRALEILQALRDEYAGQPIGNRADSLITEIEG